MGQGSNIAQKILTQIERLVRGAFYLSAGCGLLIALAQMAAVISRNVFGVNFIWLQESAIYLFAAMFLMAGGAVLLMDAHVRVDIFYARWTEKRQRWINLAGLHFFVIPVGLLIIWASAPYVHTSWSSFEGSQDPSGIQGVFLLKTLIPVFGALLIMAAAVRVGDLLEGRRHG